MTAFVLTAASLLVGLGLTLMMKAFWLSLYPRRALSYRRRYQQLIARIDLAVVKANTLANLVPHVKNARILDDFESCLRMMETLLRALNQTPNFGFDQKLITQVYPMVKRVEHKIDDTYRKFKRSIEERPLFSGLLKRWQEETAVPALGCYFCSRPFMRAYFKAATIRVEGINLRVFGCHICVAELKTRKKVKVLYFQEQGRPVHWSLVDSYKPMEQYWDLNRRKPEFKIEGVELVD